jgi:FMN phosphatase YigB (HAD superfamily)
MSGLSRAKTLSRRVARKLGGKRIASVGRKIKTRSVALTRRFLNDYRVIRSSRFFDAQWYRTMYQDVPSETDAITHYLSQGTSMGYNPGPLFDAQWYLSVNPDVAARGMNPLVHYLRRGEREGRTRRSVGAAIGKGDIYPLKSDKSPRFQGSIAVVIHAYYADVFDELCGSLNNIPGRYDLYVSVPSVEVGSQIKQSLTKHQVNANAVVRVSQNRGRNFGPFLVEFASDVLRHDFVLHLHTKKSLYTGSEQASWRNHLYDSLLSGPDVVKAILTHFNEHHDVGVLYPVISPTMPYWAHHWLSNSHLAPGLFQRLKINDYQAQGMIDYPVGGMFWARVEALRPLFTERFAYTDFPEEAGQADGTLAHAIERSIVQVAKSRGFGFGEIDYAAGVVRYNWSERNLHQYANLTSETLRARIRDAELVSFDIFDTLLLRPSASPDAVQRYAGILVMRQFPTAKGFFEIRKRAEFDARRRNNFEGDVDFAAIYAEFSQASGWSREAIEFARDTEIGLEARIVQPRAAGVDAVEYARSVGKRVIAISDTYMPRALVEQLLASVGLKQSFDDIYISSERQARKDRGDLWRLVMERERTAPHRWLHIGDNEHSDVQRPSDLGMQTFHFMNPTTLTRLRGFEAMLPYANETSWGTDLVLGPLVNRVAGSPFLPGGAFRPLALTTSFDVGYVIFGPMAFGFTAWLAKKLRALDMRHVYFLAREGYALRQFYETVKRHCADSALPDSTYLFTSRRAVLSPLQGLEFEPQEITGTAYYNGTLAGLLQSRIGLSLSQDLGLEDFELHLPEDSSRALARLRSLEPEIVKHGKNEYELYHEYCQTCGLLNEEPVAVVDIGYGATIQRVLQKLTHRPFTGFYLATFQGASDVERMGGRAFGCFSQGQPPFASQAPAVRHSLLLEAFLCAPHGQVSSLERGEDGLQPIYKADTRTTEGLAALTEMQAGANAYCEDLLRAYGPQILDLDMNLQAIQEPLKRLADREIRVPSQVGHALAVEDEFTGTKNLLVGQNLAVVNEQLVL